MLHFHISLNAPPLNVTLSPTLLKFAVIHVIYACPRHSKALKNKQNLIIILKLIWKKKKKFIL